MIDLADKEFKVTIIIVYVQECKRKQNGNELMSDQVGNCIR